jgi:hypothetical protein
VRVATKLVLDEQASASFDASASLTAPPGLPALIRCARPAAAPLRRRMSRPAPPLPAPDGQDLRAGDPRDLS